MNILQRLNKSRRLKRFFDIVFSLVVIALVLLPGLLLLALCRIVMGPGIFYRQARVGHKGKIFSLLKLRSMTNASDRNGHLLPDAQRLPFFGRLLRASSLDELPELWNVLCGDMSLVGPRPYIVDYLPYYSAEQMRRHSELPGITGWAQVMGRNALSWKRRFELDLWYIEKRSFTLDLKIIWMTLGAVLSRKGISAEGHATMPTFIDSLTTQESEGTHGQSCAPSS